MLKNPRLLLQTLILSGVLNIVFVAIFFYFVIRDNPLHFAYAPKKEKQLRHLPCPETLLTRLQTIGFDQLKEMLKDEREIKNGYRVKDFALGALVSFHHLDIKRAVNKEAFQKRTWAQEGVVFTLFPHVEDKDFQKVEDFIAREKWPYTTQGLFLEIQKKTLQECDSELLSQFCHTPEFILVQTLFARKKIPLQKRNLVALLLEGGWENLEKFHKEQEKGCDLSESSCRQFLLNYFSKGSKTASYLLLLTDEQYVLHQFDDSQMDKLVDLLTVKTKEACRFLQQLAVQQRTKNVLEKAKKRLEDFGEKEVAAKYFNRPSEGELRPKFRSTPPISVDPRTHIVEPGESLWIIARKYHISIEKLMQWNGLQSTVVRPGKMLEIPPA